MVDRTTFETVADGDYLKEGYYNGIYGSVGLRKNSSSQDVTEYSITTSTTWTTMGYSKTFTVPNSGKAFLHGIKLVFDTKSATGTTQMMRIKITNNTNGAVAYGTTYIPSGGSRIAVASETTTSSYATKTVYARLDEITGVYADSVTTSESSTLIDFEALQGGSSYTVELIAKRGNGGIAELTYVTNLTSTLFWSYEQADDVSGWA